MTAKILFVDDDTNLLEGLQRTLRKQFNLETAAGGAEGLQKLAANGPFALVVADMQMPGMSGLEFLRQVQVQAPDAVRIMLTGNADQKTAVDAVNDGRVFRFLTKPCPATTLTPALEAGLEQYRMRQLERDLLENTLGGALHVLTEILSMMDPATFQRGQRLRETYLQFAAATNVPVTWETEVAATLLSLGRVTVPPLVLEKLRREEALNVAEAEILRQIPELGARLLERIPRLQDVVAIVRHQGQRFDGSGSPGQTLAGAAIPLGVRLLKFLGDLTDLEDAGHTRVIAWQKLQERAGHYDPEILASAQQWCLVTSAPEARPEEVPVEALCPDHVLAENLLGADGLLLLSAGTQLTPMLIAKLINFRKLETVRPTLMVRTSAKR